MEKCCAYKMTLEEAQEALQNCLDDRYLRLKQTGLFYEARSDITYLDGSEVDERMAQILHVEQCEHWATDEGMVILVKQSEV